jgi:type III secretory pathway component EscV
VVLPDWQSRIQARLTKLAIDLYQKHDNFNAAEQIFERLRALSGADYEHVYANLMGNMNYYRGAYGPAAELYRHAISLRPKTALYHAHLAGALQQIETDGGSSIAAALASMRDAARLDGENCEYRERVAQLELTQAFVDHYGARSLTLVPDHTRIRILVPEAMVHHLADEIEQRLNPQFLERLERLRRDFLSETGVKIPLINFLDWSGEETCGISISGAPTARIVIAADQVLRPHEPLFDDATPLDGVLRPRGDWIAPEQAGLGALEPSEVLFRAAAHVFGMQIQLLLTHNEAEEIANAVRQVKEQAPLGPWQLNAFTAALRLDLAREGRISATTEMCDAAAALSEPADTRLPDAGAAGPPRVMVLLGEAVSCDLALMPQLFAHVQQVYFENDGIIIPAISFVSTDAANDATFTIHYGEETVTSGPGLRAGEIWIGNGWEQLEAELAQRGVDRVHFALRDGHVIAGAEDIKPICDELGILYQTPEVFLMVSTALAIRTTPIYTVTPLLAERYLQALEPRYPQLVRITRSCFSAEALARALSELPGPNYSLRNLPPLLENLVLGRAPSLQNEHALASLKLSPV